MIAKEYFAEADLPADPGLCFVLMPFGGAFDETWATIRSVVSEPPFNLLCRRADDIARPGHIMTDVLENIKRARLIITDLSGQNPNVFYELGIAHCIKNADQVILLASRIEEVPFDLREQRCVIHGGDMETLRASLAGTIEALGIKQYGLFLGEGEAGTFPRLRGNDNSLHEIAVRVEYVGEDGVKFSMHTRRYTAGEVPHESPPEGYFLGVASPHMLVPGMPWSLCYSRPDATRVRLILGRPPGWEPTKSS